MMNIGARGVFFFGICICYTLHVCKYQDVCGRLGDPVGKSVNLIYLCVVFWRVFGVLFFFFFFFKSNLYSAAYN